MTSHQEMQVAPADRPCPMQHAHVVPLDDNEARRRGSRQVRFDEQLTGMCIPSHRDLTKEGRQAIWYSRPNLATIRHDLLKDRAVVRRHQVLHNDRTGRLIPPDTETFTLRGVEHLASARAFEELYENKTRLIREVLQEQYRQQHRVTSTGSCVIPAEDHCSLRLAMLSSSMSAEATARAIARGASDQAYVFDS